MLVDLVDESPVEPASGQWFASPGEARWWFDSGSTALDFANTGALPDNIEQLHSPTDLGRWLHTRYDQVDPALSERELSDALGLRAAIANLTLCALRGEPRAHSDIDIVNLFAAMPDVPPVLEGGSRQAGASRARAGQALSSIAREAIRIFRSDAAARIRQCSAEDCSLVYLDTSRSGNRRWCSMQRCGNRAKVRAHRARAGRSTERVDRSRANFR